MTGARPMEDSIKHVSGLADSDLSKSRRKRHMLAADVSDNDNQKLPDNETHGARWSLHWENPVALFQCLTGLKLGITILHII